MTVATHAQRSQLPILAGRSLNRRCGASTAIMNAPDHTRAPAKMARKSPPHPGVSNKTTTRFSRARLQTAKFTPLAMTKPP